MHISMWKLKSDEDDPRYVSDDGFACVELITIVTCIYSEKIADKIEKQDKIKANIFFKKFTLDSRAAEWANYFQLKIRNSLLRRPYLCPTNPLISLHLPRK